MAKITLDADKCIGCGTCVALCPANYEMTGAKAKVKNDKDTGCAKQGSDNCPVNAIKIK